jgi:CRP-like cAMP-binding protein
MESQPKNSPSLQVEDLTPLEFFDSFSPAQIRELLPYLQTFFYAPDRLPILEEDVANKGIQLILEGSVMVVKAVSEDSGIKLATLRRGEIFGEASMFDDGAHTSRVEAAEPTRTVAITRESFERLREEAPHLAERIASKAAAVLSDRLRLANEAVFTYAVWSRSLRDNPPPTHWSWFPMRTDSNLVTRDLDQEPPPEKKKRKKSGRKDGKE